MGSTASGLLQSEASFRTRLTTKSVINMFPISMGGGRIESDDATIAVTPRVSQVDINDISKSFPDSRCDSGFNSGLPSGMNSGLESTDKLQQPASLNVPTSQPKFDRLDSGYDCEIVRSDFENLNIEKGD